MGGLRSLAAPAAGAAARMWVAWRAGLFIPTGE
jgi:hypothetical protein